MDDLIEEFITETSAALSQLEPALASLKTPGTQPVPYAAYDFIRAVKSAGGFLGLKRLESLSRAGEPLLMALRKTPPTQNQAAAVTALFDRIRGLLSPSGAFADAAMVPAPAAADPR